MVNNTKEKEENISKEKKRRRKNDTERMERMEGGNRN